LALRRGGSLPVSILLAALLLLLRLLVFFFLDLGLLFRHLLQGDLLMVYGLEPHTAPVFIFFGLGFFAKTIELRPQVTLFAIDPLDRIFGRFIGIDSTYLMQFHLISRHCSAIRRRSCSLVIGSSRILR